MKKEKILGFDVCSIENKKLLEKIFDDYKKNEQLFIVNINPEIIVSNYNNQEFKQVLNKQKYQIPDGTGIVWASKKRNGSIKERITGIDLMLDLCEKSQEYDAKIYLYGSKVGVAEEARKKLIEKYPKINIIGTSDGYCDEKKVIEDIQNKKADILFVGLGSPKQEEFIIKHKEELTNVKVLMPIGGSLDVISETKKRAPKWMIKSNIEWLYRLFQEPKRIFRQVKLLKYVKLVKKEIKRRK